MNEEEFDEWTKTNPKKKRTVAQQIAWQRVEASKGSLKNYKEVVDRTEGKAVQYIDATTGGEALNQISNETLEEMDRMHALQNNPITEE